MCSSSCDVERMQEILSTLIWHNQKSIKHRTQNCSWIFQLFQLTALLPLKVFNLSFFSQDFSWNKDRLILCLQWYWTLLKQANGLEYYYIYFVFKGKIITIGRSLLSYNLLYTYHDCSCCMAGWFWKIKEPQSIRMFSLSTKALCSDVHPEG